MKLLTLKYGINTGAAIAFVIGIVVFIEIISHKHHKRFDLTDSKRYTISDQSKKVIKSLKQDIKVTGFFNETQRTAEISFRDLLEQYSYHSSRFSYEFIDPDKNPAKAKRYEITSYGTVVVESGEKEEKIFDTKEEDLTNAILKVIRKGKKVIYFSKGHGEKSFGDISEQGYGFAKKIIEDSHYEAKELVMAAAETIPEDANLLIIAGPKKPILNTELANIKKFFSTGGNIFFMIDPETSTELVSFLEQYGVSLKNDIVVDKESRVFGVDPSMPVVTKYAKHPIVKNFSMATFFPLTRSVDMTINPVEGLSRTSLIKTSPNSWAETDLERFKTGEAEFDEKEDIKGPISIGVVVSPQEKQKEDPSDFKHGFEAQGNKPRKNEKSNKGRMVILGDSDFATNSRINILGNSDFFLNIINWLLEEEDLISIRPKESSGQILTLTKMQQRLIFWIPLVLMPGLFIISGLAVYKKRKNMK